ncbi:hypothetical protein AMTR_s00032p00239910 [Amborella trichopoda]|uniref:Uncharacterized protein n=1 Tax=Amborella trichopoda TaxID=13333 RepID=U5D3X2_AMBTC|nr:hypothetical protein AMTR_s00032p00239910 [Amborella trichopoda]
MPNPSREIGCSPTAAMASVDCSNRSKETHQWVLTTESHAKLYPQPRVAMVLTAAKQHASLYHWPRASPITASKVRNS